MNIIVTKIIPKPACIYCGAREGTTRDHIPPKSLFSMPRPNLVTVPCCDVCREGQSLDDEYFVRMISMRRGIVDSASAKAARNSALRALTKPNKGGFTRALLDSVKEIAVYSHGGIYLGQATSYYVDLRRLCNVIARTTRGLYFHEFKMRLPDDHRCGTYAIDGFASVGSELDSKVREMWSHAVSGKRRDFGHRVFSYWVQKLDGPEAATLWGFLVYEGVAFVAFTGPSS